MEHGSDDNFYIGYTMICLQTVKKFCKGNISEIENYDLAIADSDKCWHCHHKMEIQPDGVRLNRKWMIDHGIYFDQDPCMLVFLTESEHRSLHMLGHEVSERVKSIARSNISKLRKDNFKGHKHTEESKAKMREKRKNLHWILVEGRRKYV